MTQKLLTVKEVSEILDLTRKMKYKKEFYSLVKTCSPFLQRLLWRIFINIIVKVIVDNLD